MVTSLFKRREFVRGFTLIELLVVIAIIGILASVVLASLNSAREKSRDTRRVADLKNIQLALELYFDSEGMYPIGNFDTAMATLVTEDYLPTAPSDPVAAADYFYATDSATTPLEYHLGAILEATDGDNGVLGSDPDFDSAAFQNGFQGGAAGCSGTGTPDTCYDITP